MVMRWFRRNRKVMMAILACVLMVVFVALGSLARLLAPTRAAKVGEVRGRGVTEQELHAVSEDIRRFQPLWVGDLARCIAAAVDRADLVGASVPIGGPEHFTLEQMVSELLTVLQVRKMTVHVRMPFVRGASSLLGALFARNPIPLWMLDMIEKGSATALGSVPREFGFEPIRFSHGLDYLRRNRPWRRDLMRFLLDVGQ